MSEVGSTPLSGGVSCEVVVVREPSGREIVIKQPLPKLKVVADWHSNPERYEVEARALGTLRELLGPQAAPEVLWVDATQRRFAMERIDPRLRNWKAELLAGRVDLKTAARVGELLGLMHSRSSTRTDLAVEFRNTLYFEELRIEPFFERVSKRNPGLVGPIAMAIADLRQPGTALIHGDFSPKNLLVDGAEVVILDLEIAHWGNPRFDVAFCLSHLLLKGLRNGVDPAPFAAACKAFLDAYQVTGLPGALDASLVRILGCLMLARFDGASPVDYRDQIGEPRARKVATEFIESPVSNVEASLTRVMREG